MPDSVKVGVSKDKWPTQDVTQLLDMGALLYGNDKIHIVVMQAKCSHWVLSFETMLGEALLHVDTKEELLQAISFFNFDEFKFWNKENYENETDTIREANNEVHDMLTFLINRNKTPKKTHLN